MQPQEVNSVCLETFLELVNQTSKYHGKTYCYFHPFRARNKSYHINIVEKSTGFGVVIPFTAKSLMILEKHNMKDIFDKVLKGLLIAVDKEKEKGSPVDYKENPLTASNHRSSFEKFNKFDKVSVEVFGWSPILDK